MENFNFCVVKLKPFHATPEVWRTLSIIYVGVFLCEKNQSNVFVKKFHHRCLTISLWRLQMDWFLYDKGLCYERVNRFLDTPMTET